jgi:hypothetical protein
MLSLAWIVLGLIAGFIGSKVVNHRGESMADDGSRTPKTPEQTRQAMEQVVLERQLKWLTASVDDHDLAQRELYEMVISLQSEIRALRELMFEANPNLTASDQQEGDTFRRRRSSSSTNAWAG